MKLIFLLASFAFLLGYIVWISRLNRLLARLGARPVNHYSGVWKQVRGRLAELARNERLPEPELWILPEFSPNALVLRSRKGAKLVLTEGLLRSLNSDELDAILLLCLIHAHQPRRIVQSWVSLLLFPIARILQSYPVALQLLLAPSLTFLLRIVSTEASILRGDARMRRRGDALVVAAALQKMAVLGRKVPLKHWNFALDPLFIVSPLSLEGAPFWYFLSHPAIELRRARLLGGSEPCESSPSLP